MFYTYVLLNKSKEFYTGYCSDLKERLGRHINGEVYATKNKLPLELVYFEACISKYDAVNREKFLKSGPGKRYLKNRIKNHLNKV